MEEFAESELKAYGIPLDETLSAYSGRPIRVSNGIIATLKQKYGVKTAFAIFRRLTGVILDDDYRGEVVDRDTFRRKVRLVQDRFERLSQRQEDYSAYLSEDFVYDFQFMDKAMKAADKRKNLRPEKDAGASVVDDSHSVVSEPVSSLELGAQSLVNGENDALSPHFNATLPQGKPPRGKGKKRTLLRGKARPVLKKERLLKKELSKKTLNGRQNASRLKKRLPKPKPVAEEQKKRETEAPEDDFMLDEDEAPLKIVEQDEVSVPASTSRTNGSALKSLRAALRREMLAKKRVQALSYKLRDERLSLQESQRKLRLLEKGKMVKPQLTPESKAWKEKLKALTEELDAKQRELDKLYETNRTLLERCYQYGNQEVALRPNGKFLDDLGPCLKHLMSVGVAPEKCGEVLVTVGTLLGRKIVAEKSEPFETVLGGDALKSP